MVWETWVQSQVVSYKDFKNVLDTSLLNIQRNKVRIKTPLHFGVVAIEREPSVTLDYGLQLNLLTVDHCLTSSNPT